MTPSQTLTNAIMVLAKIGPEHQLIQSDIDCIVRSREKHTAFLWLATHRVRSHYPKGTGIQRIGQTLRHLSIKNLLTLINSDRAERMKILATIRKRGRHNTSQNFITDAPLTFSELLPPKAAKQWALKSTRNEKDALKILRPYLMLMFTGPDAFTLYNHLSNETLDCLEPLVCAKGEMQEYINANDLAIAYDPIELPNREYNIMRMDPEQKRELHNLRVRKEGRPELQRPPPKAQDDEEDEEDDADNVKNDEERSPQQLPPPQAQEDEEDDADDDDNVNNDEERPPVNEGGLNIDSSAAMAQLSPPQGDNNATQQTIVITPAPATAEAHNTVLPEDSSLKELDQSQTEAEKEENPSEVERANLQRDRILYPGSSPSNEFTEDDMVAMKEDVIRDKLRIIARAHLTSYYTDNADALYMHFASQSALQMINLMYKRGKLKAWVEKQGIAPGQVMAEGENRARNREGERWGAAGHASNFETSYDLRIKRQVKLGRNHKNASEVMAVFALPMYELAKQLHHTFRIVSPKMELDLAPILAMDDAPTDLTEYMMNVQNTSASTIEFQMKVATSMKASQLRNWGNTDVPDEQSKLVSHLRDFHTHMHIIGQEQSTHSAGFILVGTNEWDSSAEIIHEVTQRVGLWTGKVIGDEDISVAWRKICTPRKEWNLHTYAYALDIKDVGKNDVLKVIDELEDSVPQRRICPVTYNIFFARAQAHDDESIEELEAAIILQNKHLAERYICTITGIPEDIDIYHQYHFGSMQTTPCIPASVLMFGRKWYEREGFHFDKYIKKMGILPSGDYYIQGKRTEANELLAFLNNHFAQAIQILFERDFKEDQHDFSQIEIFGRSTSTYATKTATDILKESTTSTQSTTTYSYPPLNVAPPTAAGAQATAEREAENMKQYGTTSTPAPHPAVIQNRREGSISGISQDELSDELDRREIEISSAIRQDMTMLAQEMLKCFGIYSPQFDPFKMKQRMNSTASNTQDTDGTSMPPPPARPPTKQPPPQLLTPQQPAAAILTPPITQHQTTEEENPNDASDEEFNELMQTQSVNDANAILAAKESFDNEYKQGIGLYTEDSRMTEDQTAEISSPLVGRSLENSMLAMERPNHSWDETLNHTSYKSANETLDLDQSDRAQNESSRGRSKSRSKSPGPPSEKAKRKSKSPRRATSESSQAGQATAPSAPPSGQNKEPETAQEAQRRGRPKEEELILEDEQEDGEGVDEERTNRRSHRLKNLHTQAQPPVETSVCLSSDNED